MCVCVCVCVSRTIDFVIKSVMLILCSQGNMDFAVDSDISTEQWDAASAAEIALAGDSEIAIRSQTSDFGTSWIVYRSKDNAKLLTAANVKRMRTIEQHILNLPKVHKHTHTQTHAHTNTRTQRD